MNGPSLTLRVEAVDAVGVTRMQLNHPRFEQGFEGRLRKSAGDGDRLRPRCLGEHEKADIPPEERVVLPDRNKPLVGPDRLVDPGVWAGAHRAYQGVTRTGPSWGTSNSAHQSPISMRTTGQRSPTAAR